MKNLLSMFAVTTAVVIIFIFNVAAVEKNQDILLDEKTSFILKFLRDPIHLFSNVTEKAITYSVERQTIGENSWTSSGVLVSHLSPENWKFVSQSTSGVTYLPNEMVTFAFNSSSPLKTVFRVTVNTDGNIRGRAVLEPFKEDETAGYRNVTLLDEHWNAVGEVRITYLVVRPVARFNSLFNGSYSDFDHVVFMGHRGTGIGKRFDLPQEFIENTIAAFNYACSKGADAIELDVQLSQPTAKEPATPIIYHDFFVKTFLHDRKDAHHNVSLHLPIKDIPLHDMARISTNYMPHVRPNIETEDNQSFETLENVLKKVKPGCGINVEIKYPQLKMNQHNEDALGAELNDYTDRILEVLYAHAGSRPIVITTFHADLATMVQLKQNRFRVAFLTSGGTKDFYYDTRASTVELGTAFVQSFNMKGLSLETGDVLAMPKHIQYVRSRGLALYLWGNELDTYQRLVVLKKEGVTALIFNNLDRILANHTKTDFE